jgi:hypothetical protein
MEGDIRRHVFKKINLELAPAAGIVLPTTVTTTTTINLQCAPAVGIVLPRTATIQ